jgi:hypothetical protein
MPLFIPAKPGLYVKILNIFKVNCGSCWAFEAIKRKIQKESNIAFLRLFIR